MKDRFEPDLVAGVFDEYGEQEWTRFEQPRMGVASLGVHLHYLREFVAAGDRVLDAGAGPGRFTIELARLGARVVVLDLSPGQLELNRQNVSEAGCDDAVEDRAIGDITNLDRFDDAEFDVVVCYGAPLSYVVHENARAVQELARVTRRGGHLLVSVASLVGVFAHYGDIVLDLITRDGRAPIDTVRRTGVLPMGPDYGHLPMKLYRWRELEALLSPHGEIVARAAAGLVRTTDVPPAELREQLVEAELDVGAERAAIDAGEHMLAVVRVG